MNHWLAVLLQKCPRCRIGDMFKFSLTQFWKFNHMHKQCPHCQTELIPEPGFYIGAMYFSYAFNVGIVVVIFFALRFFFPNESIPFYVGIVVSLIVFLFPFNFRVSRSMMLHWFGGIQYNEHEEE